MRGVHTCVAVKVDCLNPFSNGCIFKKFCSLNLGGKKVVLSQTAKRKGLRSLAPSFRKSANSGAGSFHLRAVFAVHGSCSRETWGQVHQSKNVQKSLVGLNLFPVNGLCTSCHCTWQACQQGIYKGTCTNSFVKGSAGFESWCVYGGQRIMTCWRPGDYTIYQKLLQQNKSWIQDTANRNSLYWDVFIFLVWRNLIMIHGFFSLLTAFITLLQ